MSPAPMPHPSQLPLAFVGGTGPEGTGLALRFAAAGHPVIVGSRDAGRAREAAAKLAQQTPGSAVTGQDNLEAAAAAGAAFITVPYSAQAQLLPGLTNALDGKLVIGTVAPIVFQGGRPRPFQVPDGSAAQEAQRLLPGAKVVAAFHHLSAGHLADLAHALEGDVLVCGDDPEARNSVMELVRELKDLRPVDAGELFYAGTLEALTAVLIGINRRYRTESGVSIVGLPPSPLP